MKRCDKMVEVGRRQFLRGGIVAAATLPVVGLSAQQAKAATNGALLDYPSTRLANLKDLKVNEPVEVAYPDAEAPGVLLKLGKAVEGGVGPEGDIVAFSTVCPHKGFPLAYNAERKTLNCPGHYSVFDCEAGGQQTWGQATQNLPQYMLRIDDKGDIYAEGVDELLYGRLSNVL
ncbi:arsenate reductase (azurin) small subunit [Aestuariivirga sp.]|uniref:arsenate reductase (azurin) small subunit n=1 Tax=Aestuariivirga sp. TaxID=2650926 RepID=UPI00391D1A5A